MMTKILRYSLTLLFFTFIGNLFAYKNVIIPPDSATNIVDKTTANYIIDEGKTMYGLGQIKGALRKFRQAGAKDPNSWKAAYWIGKCHYKFNNFGYALTYINSAMRIGKDKVNDEIYFFLGSVNHRLGNLDSAIANYQKADSLFSKSRSNTLGIQHHVNECNFAKAQIKKGKQFEKTPIGREINSGFDDYHVLLAQDNKTIYFVSRRSNTTGGGINPDDQRYFEDIYKSIYDDEIKGWGTATNQLGKLNSNGFDALNYISDDGLYAYLTVNSTATDAKKTTKGSDICEAKRSSKGTWNSPKPIKEINTSYFEGSATLTADGNTMYFVSDRKGEKRSTDIYVSYKNGKFWSSAIPLSDSINTTGRETTPSISPDGRFLFFSSDGHLGLGDLDVYVSENLGNTWNTPVNLGYGINSVNNDTHFSYNEELKKAFISGFEIVEQKASIDCYEIDMQNFEYPKAD